MEEKIFFSPGDLVTLKQNLPNKPVMIVIHKEIKTFRLESPTESSKKVNYFVGIKCRWFTEDGTLQETIWNTKDLCKI